MKHTHIGIMLQYPGAPDIKIDKHGNWFVDGKPVSSTKCIEAMTQLVLVWADTIDASEFDEIWFLNTMDSG